uniref:Pentatricopeptide repeat-containing protein At1g66345, mitochondrial n=1 Tax=Anthurium amnicola TaxID=1678845 RepID=A0A1D1ZM85_9ARAE
MNRLFRSHRSLALLVFRKFRDSPRQEVEFAYVRDCGIPLLRPVAERFCTKKEEGVEVIGPTSNMLRKGGNWESLDACFKSVELSNQIVDGVLLNLKEPVDAKKALVFFHWCSRCRNYQHKVWSYGLMIHILVRAGLLVDARVLLESVVLKNSESEASLFAIVETLLDTYEAVLSNPRVFDFLVQTYSKLRMFDMALRATTYVGERGFLLSLTSFNTLLHVVQRSDQNNLVWKIYEYMFVKRIYPNQWTVEIMVNAMCKEGSLLKVVDVLDRIHGKRCSPTMIVNTALTHRIIDENRAEEGIILLKRMLQKNMILDDIACSITVYAHCKMGSLQLAYDSYEDMLNRGQCMNSYVCTLLIGLLCREGSIEDANRLMQEMLLAGLNPYDETYNLLIEWCSRLGRLEESLAFYNQMLDKGFLPSCSAVNEMIVQLCKAGNVESANNTLTVLLDKGFIPDELTYSNLIDGFGRAGKFQEVLKLYHEMEWRGPSPSLVAYTAVIRSLCQCKKSEEAEKVLTVMQEKSLLPSGEIFELILKK